MRWGVAFLVGIGLSFSATFADGQETTSFSRGDLDFFEAKVRPVLVQRCWSCHSTNAKKTRGGLNLDHRAGILKGGDSGPAAMPGKPGDSLLIRAVHYEKADLSMPPSGKLPGHEIAALIEWVRRGLPFPSLDKQPMPAGKIEVEQGRRFWSFQPLEAKSPPAVKDHAWVKRPLDAFILAELEKQGLNRSPSASPRTLVRRLYFDLIGLPPTPEEMEAFVNDPAPDAYARLVERLLASPQHGERWARFWLDLARYCDVAEPWAENKGKAFLYRDWVVQALNDDLPFDRFVLLQLAADLLPGAQPGDVAALGFLGLSPSYWKELKLAPDVIKTVVAEEWEERIHTVTSTFLGLTVGCARCHDHKYDPVTTEDYYALAGIFASTRLADRSPLPREQAARVEKAQSEAKALQAQLTSLKDVKTSEAEEQKIELKALIEDLRQTTPHFDQPLAPGVEEASLHVLPDGPHKTKLVYKAAEVQDVAMQVRGNPASPGPVVPRRFLTVLSPGTPRPFTKGSGRLELAQAIVGDAAPLTARVIVNRVWKHHFGRGLVETPSDFGAQGDRPSHPALLDHLAARFITNGWSLRWLHREIVLSATYQQASVASKKHLAADPDNRFLGRMSRRRLEVEAWRDAMLAVSGSLDRTIGGPAMDLSDASNRRRTLYGTVKRRELNDLLRLFDFPDPTTHSPSRVPTTTALQQLFTLNSPLVDQQAAALAQRVQRDAPLTDLDARIHRIYWLLFGRAPTETQLRLGLDFLATETEELWRQYAQVLLGSNEFMFVD